MHHYFCVARAIACITMRLCGHPSVLQPRCTDIRRAYRSRFGVKIERNAVWHAAPPLPPPTSFSSPFGIFFRFFAPQKFVHSSNENFYYFLFSKVNVVRYRKKKKKKMEIEANIRIGGYDREENGGRAVGEDVDSPRANRVLRSWLTS